MTGFITKTPDIDAEILRVLGAVEQAELIKPELAEPYRVLVSRADLQQRVTPLSRYCRVGVQAWSVRVDGLADLPDAFDLCAAAGEALEASPLASRIILSAEIQSGPSRVADDVTRIEYQYLTALLEVAT
jgi:hypothetical protein